MPSNNNTGLTGQEDNTGVKHSFTRAYPLDFNLVQDKSGSYAGFSDNALFIIDAISKDPIKQTLIINNISEHKLDFIAIKSNTPDGYNCNFEIKFRNDTFAGNGTFPKFDVKPDWIISQPVQNAEDGSWSVFFLTTKKLTLAKGKTLEFPFQYNSAAGVSERGTRADLYFNYLQFEPDSPIQGVRTKQLHITNLSTNDVHTKKLIENINNTDAKVDRQEQELKEKVLKIKSNVAKKSGSFNYPNLPDVQRKNILQSKINSETIVKITDVVEVLVDHGIELDNELDKKTELFDNKLQKLGNSYPFSITCKAPTGLVCNQDSSLEIYLYNHSDQTIEFENSGKIKMIFSTGYSEGDLADNQTNCGNATFDSYDGTFEKDNNSSYGECQFTWTANGNTIRSGKYRKFEIKNIKPNDTPGNCFVNISVSGVTGYQNHSFSLNLTKKYPDLGQFVGAHNVGIGTRHPKEKLDVDGNINTQQKILEGGNALIPKGTIVMWAGTSGSVPSGWALCDGDYSPDYGDYTPNLSGRFIVGVGNGFAHKDTGGEKKVKLEIDQMPFHSHDISDLGHSHDVDDDGHSHSISYMDDSYTDKDDDSLPVYARRWGNQRTESANSNISIVRNESNITLGKSGGHEAHENLPPYFALCFIIKIK